jgi:RNA-directed DNA polymerase
MVKKLQSLLVKSLNARILAVKRVSENKGKNTAGVDGKLLDTNIKKVQICC